MKASRKLVVAVCVLVAVAVFGTVAYASSVDTSTMKRSEIIALVFEEGYREDSDGFCIKGTIKKGLDVKLGGVVESAQLFYDNSVHELAPGDVLTTPADPDYTNKGYGMASMWFSVNSDDGEKKPVEEVTEITADKLKIEEDLRKYFTVNKVGNSGEVEATVPANTKFTVYKTWRVVNAWKKDVAVGESYTTGATAETTTWWPNPEEQEKEKATRVKEIPADKLVSAHDLSLYFKMSQEDGKDGELVATVPAYTKFTVYKSWTAVDTAKGKLKVGESYTTGATAETTTWWPDLTYWNEANAIEVSPENYQEYLEPTSVESDGKWAVFTIKKGVLNGRKLRAKKGSGLVVLVVHNGEITNPQFVDEDTEGDVYVAKEADLNNSNGKLFESVDNIKKVAPWGVKVTAQKDGKIEVIFYAGASTLYLDGTNLFKYFFDITRVEEILAGGVVTTASAGTGKMLQSKDGRAIGEMTVYLNEEEESTSGGNSSSGGCNGGFGALALLLLPLFFQKGKKSN